MKVKAKAAGQYGGIVRRRGDVFEWTDGKPGNWVEPLEKPKKPAPKAAKPKGSDLA